MAGHYAILKNAKRKELSTHYAAKRAALKAVAHNRKTLASDPEKFAAQIALQLLPRNSAKVRYKNRCQVSGRPHAYIGFFGMSRIALRDYASWGWLPGVIKSSW